VYQSQDLEAQNRAPLALNNRAISSYQVLENWTFLATEVYSQPVLFVVPSIVQSFIQSRRRPRSRRSRRQFASLTNHDMFNFLYLAESYSPHTCSTPPLRIFIIFNATNRITAQNRLPGLYHGTTYAKRTCDFRCAPAPGKSPNNIKGFKIWKRRNPHAA
jgi:hypothetical protein